MRNQSTMLILRMFIKNILKSWIQAKIFLQSDMDEFAKYKTKLDDYLKTGDITFFKLTNDRYLQRLTDIEKMSQDIFAKPINLDEDEDIIMEPKLKKNPANQKEMYAEWKKFIKYNILQEMQTLNEKEESQKRKRLCNC